MKKIAICLLALMLLWTCPEANGEGLDADAPVALTQEHFPSGVFRDYLAQKADMDQDGYLSRQEREQVTRISVNGMEISSLEGLSWFPKLETLYCEDNALTELDVSGNPALTSLSCGDNALTELDVSGNPALTSLSCGDNALTELDVSGNLALTSLSCWNNALTELDVTANRNLERLTCDSNPLGSLDLSGNSRLEYLHCCYNDLTELDLGYKSALEDVTCYDNFLTELDTGGCPALKRLHCGSDTLERLDVRRNTKLESLNFRDSKVESIDLSQNTLLKDLNAMYCRLTSLDLSSCAITELSAWGNAYEITVDSSLTFDLQDLPGSFDVSRSSRWEGGSAEGTVLRINPGVDQVTYRYDLGNGSYEHFQLDVAFSEEHYAAEFTQVSVSLAGDIGLNFYISLSDMVVADPEARMRFEVAGEIQEIPMGQGIRQKDGTYRFTCKLAAKNMADRVTAQMYGAPGPLGYAKTSSVQEYCGKMIDIYGNIGEYQPLIKLLEAMLNYGAQSQISLGYNTNFLANGWLTESQKKLPTPHGLSGFQPRVAGSMEGLTVQSASLLLKTTTTIRLYFYLIAPLEAVTVSVDGTALTPVSRGSQNGLNYYYVDLAGITARNLDTTYTFLLDGGERGSMTVSYSGMSYVYSVMSQIYLSNGEKAMAKALYGYAMAANDYFGNG